MKPEIVKLEKDEKIIAVVPEHCNGPGWRNSVVWVYICDSEKRLRTVCLQPENQTYTLTILFDIGEKVCNALIASIPVEVKK